MVRFSRRKPHHCLLLTNTNSTVPEYADEFVFVKYTYLLSKSTPRVEVSTHRAHRRHAEGLPHGNPFFMYLFLFALFKQHSRTDDTCIVTQFCRNDFGRGKTGVSAAVGFFCNKFTNGSKQRFAFLTDTAAHN